MRFRITLALVALLVLGMAGTANAQTPSQLLGDLVVVHDLLDAPDVNLHVLPYGTNAEVPVANGLDAGQQSARIPLPPGDHILVIDDAETGEELGACAFTVVSGVVTTAYASDCLGIEPGPSESPSATASPTATATATATASPTATATVTASPTATATATASPTATATASASPRPSASAVRTPSRVETGAGGTAGDSGALVLAGLAGLAALASAGVLVTRGRRS